MAQYINKSALVAEIEKKKIPFKRDIEDGVYPTYLCALMDFEDFINTLEVKEIGIDISNIDDLLEEDSIDPNSKEAKIFKESYYMALEKLKGKIV